MNNLAVINRSQRLPRSVQHPIARISPASSLVLESLLEKVERLEQKVNTLQTVHQPYAAQPTSRWISATPVEKALPPAEPAPVAPRRMKVRRSSLLDIFD